MRFYMFRITGENGFVRNITRRADKFLKLINQLYVEYPEHRIDYIG